MRKLVMLLLLAVFFLTGMVLGTQQQGSVTSVESNINEEEVAGVAIEMDSPLEIVEEPISNTIEIQGDHPTHITQQVAKTIEHAGVWFYDQVIDVAYGLSQIFI
ncbi:hypothetical protein GCM10011351_16580 [Paraliobacillus quinghaiensis]|uniref:Uncharacterized protein n=1 Tax=Paraliobacillus quinghaiensis TaxID=470815 RepID=A0A917TPD4_9BACI|nr:hypothetical protein [Paraliobacillus quinghaiensis]GGM31128.1 hypothetical protein GCM10011351_16580 [Paraliobacillus quinghaiensis]